MRDFSLNKPLYIHSLEIRNDFLTFCDDNIRAAALLSYFNSVYELDLSILYCKDGCPSNWQPIADCLIQHHKIKILPKKTFNLCPIEELEEALLLLENKNFIFLETDENGDIFITYNRDLIISLVNKQFVDIPVILSPNGGC